MEASEVPVGITLLKYNQIVKDVIFCTDELQNVWVTAELSDVGVNRTGHCYLELIQKNDKTGVTEAKLRAIIWGSTFPMLKYKFESVTEQKFTSGIKVMVKLSANFHEQYGLSAVISDIYPEFTLGDMVKKRLEIIKRLKADRIIDMNKSLEWPEVPQRIAIISSATAAGYGDFMNQLSGNAGGIAFYTCLFQAMMQGTETVPSVLEALDRINEHIELFDCVVIIRGGGATSDLNWFDDYDLASTIAQFPIPIIIGIGHERDTTVLDYVAALRVKTPTDAAQTLINKGTAALDHVDDLSKQVVNTVQNHIKGAKEQLTFYSATIAPSAKNTLEKSRMKLEKYLQALSPTVHGRLMASHTELKLAANKIAQNARQKMQSEGQRVKALEEKVEILSPRNTLKRGYTLTMHDGKIITDASMLKIGDAITTHFNAGAVASTVETVKENEKSEQ
ncbi:MAG: exodeoxyribonuclease VII large subunit [Muribaculaceae bacterium]|jgi:exodeoxyribonuclease VII large subunit|nr:exodeoxyribonuclease VII large subunit [Muribaculaceae bacterium]